MRLTRKLAVVGVVLAGPAVCMMIMVWTILEPSPDTLKWAWIVIPSRRFCQRVGWLLLRMRVEPDCNGLVAMPGEID